MAGYVQASLDDLGTPLADVTFCVLDLETTGGDRGTDRITEIGVVKVRGGELLGTLQTLVHPEVRIPPAITVLTGITEAMVAEAPRLDAVLPTVLEFLEGAVLVGHNVRFDVDFLNAALARRGDPPLRGRVVDTLALARRLVRDEVPDCRLGTLATRLRLTTRPTHRAFDDAMATTELLHLLLERAATWGVLGLDDLLALPRLGGHPQAAKLRLTRGLPRAPGVYLFRDGRGEVLYVGKATNLRDRVRSYFGSDDRRKIGALLRETASISVEETADVLVAEVLEARLLRQLRPRYNRAGTQWPMYCYVRLTVDEPWPRLVVSTSAASAGLVLGPLPSRQAATLAVEALHTVFPLRRCTARLGPRRRVPADASPCTAHQLGRAYCPCSGTADPVAYRALVDEVVRTLRTTPQTVIDRLGRRMADLARQRRYEEAAAVRDRAQAFAGLVQRTSTIDQLRRAGRIVARLGDTTVEIVDGVLARYQPAGRLAASLSVAPPPTGTGPVAKEAVDEMLVIARALQRRANGRVLVCDGEWASTVPRVEPPTRLARAG